MFFVKSSSDVNVAVKRVHLKLYSASPLDPLILSDCKTGWLFYVTSCAHQNMSRFSWTVFDEPSFTRQHREIEKGWWVEEWVVWDNNIQDDGFGKGDDSTPILCGGGEEDRTFCNKKNALVHKNANNALFFIQNETIDDAWPMTKSNQFFPELEKVHLA